ncbi:MAG: hypothetical protein FWD50_06325 [Betaproteobacteria bacterium]|nr:hypothetical protein [Betaproteobacteria bacterium]
MKNGDAKRIAAGRAAHFDKDSTCYSLHLGGGYLWAIDSQNNLDVYAKCFWTRQDGQNAKLDSGDRGKFADVGKAIKAPAGGRISCDCCVAA